MQTVLHKTGMGGIDSWPNVVGVAVSGTFAVMVVTRVTRVVSSGIDQEHKVFCLVANVLRGFAYECWFFVHGFVRFAFLDAMAGLFAMEAYASEGCSFYIWYWRYAISLSLSRLLPFVFSFAFLAFEFSLMVVLSTMFALSSAIASAFAFVFAFWRLSFAFGPFPMVRRTRLFRACMG